MKRLAILLVLLTPTQALAQQTTLYGPDGRVAARCSKDSGGQTTCYGPDGRVIERSMTQGGQTVFYGPDGRRLGTAVRP
jgi:hypothetical protein